MESGADTDNVICCVPNAKGLLLGLCVVRALLSVTSEAVSETRRVCLALGGNYARDITHHGGGGAHESVTLVSCMAQHT